MGRGLGDVTGVRSAPLGCVTSGRDSGAAFVGQPHPSGISSKCRCWFSRSGGCRSCWSTGDSVNRKERSEPFLSWTEVQCCEEQALCGIHSGWQCGRSALRSQTAAGVRAVCSQQCPHCVSRAGGQRLHPGAAQKGHLGIVPVAGPLSPIL